MNEFAKRCIEAHQNATKYPNASAAQATLDVATAYQWQSAFIDLLTTDDVVVGYKAALTAPGAQQHMGIDTPIIGSLLASGDWQAQADAPLTVRPGTLLETELGFVLKQNLLSPVAPEAVFDAVASVCPMIELALPNLREKPTGIDLIATNSASYGFLKGAPQAVTGHTWDVVEATLSHEDNVLFSGQCGEVLDGQQQALSWLINTCLAQGRPLNAGQLLMTGAIGGVAPAKSGHYSGQFGNVCRIEFDIQLAGA